jgi:hypothetical protein
MVPTDCVANERAFTPGQYILVPNDTRNLLTLETRDLKKDVMSLPVKSPMAEHKPLAEPEIVFDTLNGQGYVSELLLPADGYLVLVTKGKHTHESLKGSRAKKSRRSLRVRRVLRNGILVSRAAGS